MKKEGGAGRRQKLGTVAVAASSARCCHRGADRRPLPPPLSGAATLVSGVDQPSPPPPLPTVAAAVVVTAIRLSFREPLMGIATPFMMGIGACPLSGRCWCRRRGLFLLMVGCRLAGGGGWLHAVRHHVRGDGGGGGLLLGVLLSRTKEDHFNHVIVDARVASVLTIVSVCEGGKGEGYSDVETLSWTIGTCAC